jgi:hypothetical protein
LQQSARKKNLSIITNEEIKIEPFLIDKNETANFKNDLNKFS